MATTYYINKSGSNANNGTTPTLAKLTITAGIALMASGDSLVVGSGLYNETITTQPQFVTIIYADGDVVVDGNSLSGSLVTLNATANSTNKISFLPYSTGGTWTFQNSPSTPMFNTTSPTNYGNITLQNCTLISNSTTYALYSNQGYVFSLLNCILIGFTTAAIYQTAGNSYNTISLIGCTFYNCAIVVLAGQGSFAGNFPVINQNIFVNGTTAISYLGSANATLAAGTVLNNNDYYGYTNILKTQTSTYTTLASVQALGYGWEAQGMTTNPVFEDTSNNILYPTVQLSPLIQIGAYPFSLIRGSNYNPDSKWNIIAAGGYDNSGWYNPDGNVTMVSNMFQLTSGTSGVIWSPVYDLGSTQTITQFNVEAIQIWPANMVDKTTSDVRPNYQTAEIRASATTFNQNDGVIAWTELRNKINFITQGSTYITGRYVQIRLTLTNADVAA